MSLGRPEKIVAHDRGRWRRYAKQARNRKLRRLAAQDVENAPTKLGYYGWST